MSTWTSKYLRSFVPFGGSSLQRLRMHCWICGNIADSKEHTVKASDVRAYFGEISEGNPVYKSSGDKTNQIIKSSKSINLKTKKYVICQSCNNSETSCHDKAWSSVHGYMRKNWNFIKNTRKLNLKKIFPGKSRKEAIHFHLFFVKHMGCRVVDENIPISIDMFSNAVNNNIPHENLYLSFHVVSNGLGEVKSVGLSEVHGREENGRPISLSYFYTIGELMVQVTWFENKPYKNVRNAWHPDGRSNVIKINRS